MSFLARDIYEAGTAQLRNRTSNRIPDALAHHILARLLDSFSGPNVIAKWLDKTRSLGHDTVFRGAGLFRQSLDEYPAIIADIDAGILSPIGLILTESFAPWDVFKNHVVLVWGYEWAGSILTMRTYDCNFPGKDDITISFDASGPVPAKTISTNGSDVDGQPGTVRGFFRLPYERVDPAPAYIDDARIEIQDGHLRMLEAGESSEVGVILTNQGTTTWERSNGYRLGTQSPQDNMTWGTNRTELPFDVEPEMNAHCLIPIKAPSTAGRYILCVQMLRELVAWFGSISPQVPFSVGAVDGGPCAELRGQHEHLAAQLDEIESDIASVDRSDRFAARREIQILSARARQTRNLIAGLEKRQVENGCAPG